MTFLSTIKIVLYHVYNGRNSKHICYKTLLIKSKNVWRIAKVKQMSSERKRICHRYAIHRNAFV